ncbi:MAG: hypothetical protein II309_01135 [Bacilli bacterium]|nr:hypothetical protein [Bacilli bacterium]
MNIFKLLKENLNIAIDNFEASNRNANIEYAYRILPRAEIARFNAHTVQLTKGFLASNYTAREIKLQEINFHYFTEEEKHVLYKVIDLVEIIQQRYLNGKLTLEEAEKEAFLIRQELEVKTKEYKKYIKK